MKICNKCKIEKDENEFHKCKKTRLGLKANCKICRNIESKNYAKIQYDIDPEKFIKKNRDWKKNNPEKLIISNRKSCKKRYEKFSEERKKYNKFYRDKYAEEKKLRDSQWRLKNPDKVKEHRRVAARNQRKNDPEKVSARLAIMHEIKMGRIVKPNNCSRCLKECKPEGHHPDYSKPLEVIWLCRQCHNKEHKK
jgi:hypothetical protein